MKIAFDIGGVLGKYPAVFGEMIKALVLGGVEIYIITDIPNKKKAQEILTKHGYVISSDYILCADYATYGERCKSVVVKEYGIDVLIDDYPAYCQGADCVSLLVWPNANIPYERGETR